MLYWAYFFLFSRNWVWGSYHCFVPSVGHQDRQSAWPTRSFLPSKPAKSHQLDCNRFCLWYSYLLPGKEWVLPYFENNLFQVPVSKFLIVLLLTGLPCGSANQISSLQRPVQLVPNQVVLHIKHSHHFAGQFNYDPLITFRILSLEVLNKLS